jgi:hypothetical protein
MMGGMGGMVKGANSGGDVRSAAGGRGMMGGMAGAGMGGMGAPGGTGAVSRKDMKFLTRTDFLLQFVWIPVKPGSLPQNPEELKTKLDDEAKKLAEAEKAYAGDTSTAKLEETIEAESLKKSKAVDAAFDKAIGGANAQGVPGNVPPAAGLPGNVPPPAGTPPKSAVPPSK